jgi:hypothetical protein
VEPAKSTFIYVGLEQVSNNVVYRPSPQFGQALKPVYSLRKARPSCHEAAAHDRQHWHRGSSGATPGQLLCLDFGYHVAINRFQGFLVSPRLHHFA